jgi:phage head maturation protease
MPEMQTADPPRLEARFAPSTFNADQRTVEMSWSRGVRVRRNDWRTGQPFYEELSMDRAAVDLSMLNAGAPFLASHNRQSLEAVLGVVERAWITDGEGRALVRFSEREAVAPIIADIRAGILRNISVGYSVEEWEEKRAEDGVLIKRARRWTPFEVSLVPIPADASAQVRAAGAASAAEGINAPRREGESMADTPAGAADMARADTPTTPAPTPADLDQVRAAERARIASLDEPARMARTRGLDEQQVTALVARARDGGHDAGWLRGELFGAIVAADQSRGTPAPTPVSQFGRSYEDPAVIVEAMATAIAARHMPAVAARAGEGQWRNFAGLRPSDMLIELAQARGERVGPRDRDRLISRAFHTSSDFPLLLANAGNKMLEAGYAVAAPSYRRFFARRRFNDFKAHSFLTAGDFPALAALREGGEITRGTISEKREQITPGTFARGVAVTRQMLVNDDLGAFSDFGTMIGRRIADWENATAYAVVNTASGDGPTLSEGNAAVFGTAASRANKAASGTTVTALALGAGFNGMKSQTSLDKLNLNIEPRFLVCSVIQEFVAAQFASSAVVPSAAGSVNPFAARFEVISDANIPNNRWYLFADPAAAPVYVYGYVGDNEVPQVRVGQPMGVDGTVVEVVHDFAVGAIDYRGGWFNPGAAPT